MYAFVQDVPVGAEVYRRIRAGMPEEPPEGLVFHLVVPREGGRLRYIDVWETEADWQRFRDEVVEPAVGKVLAEVGVPHDHSQVHAEDLEVVDLWLGARAG